MQRKTAIKLPAKLEFKHLVPYLPYGLKAKYYFDNGDLIGDLDCVDISGNHILLFDDTGDLYDVYNINDNKIKLILYPLSDLTNKVTINGETFVPIKEINELLPDLIDFDKHLELEVDTDSYGTTRYIDWNTMNNATAKLFEWHFDVFKLIDKGLAINVNDLPENPYE